MTIDLSTLSKLEKLLFDISLAPVQGHRFQPTGFPDLGAATYETASGTSLLVESTQSMANRMESTCWDDATQALVPELKGLSYIRIHDKGGKFLTSSMLDAHRINSVYVEKADSGKFHEMLGKEIGYADAKPIDRPAFVGAVFKYDAGSLLHGVFLESIGGRLRLARAMSAFIEADGVAVAASGGVKNDHIMPGKEEGKTSAEGFGNVPFHRDEFTAKAITLFANVDLAQIRGYGLGESATRLLTLLSLYKIRGLVDGKLRLRTACDFKVTTDSVRASNGGFVLPSRADLVADLAPAIASSAPMFAKENGVTTLTYAG
jgi:CRISPR-associated protein Csb1